MLKVFLSHNSKDKPTVRKLAELLNQEKGIIPWLDEWNLIPGGIWQEELEKALEESDVCLCLIGQEEFGPWQHEEMRVAISIRVQEHNRNFRVIPVLLPGGLRGDRSKLPLFLKRSTWVKFNHSFNEKENYRRLIRGIQGLPPGPPISSKLSNQVSPFVGLRFFDVDQSDLFFGREADKEWLINDLNPEGSDTVSNPFLVILGASGSGKSSLARAGLLAELKKDVFPNSSDWTQIIVYPGENPLENLSLALAKEKVLPNSALEVDDFREGLLNNERLLFLQGRLFCDQQSKDHKIVLLIDQFEEIFTLCKDKKQQKAFIQNLCNAATINPSNWIVILTLRSDFFGKCATFPKLSALVSKHNYLVEPMGQIELSQIIESPIHLAGLTIDDVLVDNLVRLMLEEPNSLPLLQDTLQELWNKRVNNHLSYETYKSLGGIAGALNKRATTFHDNLSIEDQDFCRQIFLLMVQAGEGAEDTKRRVSKEELLTIEAPAGSVERIVQHLSSSNNRFLVADENYYEISHEALIREWGLLREWIDEDRKNLIIHARLRQDVKEWENNNQDHAYLYKGSQLLMIQNWSEQYLKRLTVNEKKFLFESLVMNGVNFKTWLHQFAPTMDLVELISGYVKSANPKLQRRGILLIDSGEQFKNYEQLFLNLLLEVVKLDKVEYVRLTAAQKLVEIGHVKALLAPLERVDKISEGNDHFREAVLKMRNETDVGGIIKKHWTNRLRKTLRFPVLFDLLKRYRVHFAIVIAMTYIFGQVGLQILSIIFRYIEGLISPFINKDFNGGLAVGIFGIMSCLVVGYYFMIRRRIDGLPLKNKDLLLIAIWSKIIGDGIFFLNRFFSKSYEVVTGSFQAMTHFFFDIIQLILDDLLGYVVMSMFLFYFFKSENVKKWKLFYYSFLGALSFAFWRAFVTPFFWNIFNIPYYTSIFKELDRWLRFAYELSITTGLIFCCFYGFMRGIWIAIEYDNRDKKPLL